MVAAGMKMSTRSTESDREQSYWHAVEAKDGARDGEFVYAVRSTGVYCRPSCPSRRPKRENVQFFALPELAESAGFRSCRRCHPENTATADPQVEMVRSICRFIESHSSEQLSLDLLAEQGRISPYHLHRTFKRIAGVTPRQYADACRAEKFKSQLKSGDSVTRAMYEAGYGSSRGLYEHAPERLGMTPASYRRRGKGMRIGYTIVDCPLGQLLVGATERGICAVRLGDSRRVLEEDLLAEFPEAEIAPASPALDRSTAKILAHLEGRRPDLDLPLDIQATAFQARVWEELRAIPYGSTASYSDVAKAIGRPTAVRAVARACATNPVALVIPCHRVVREDRSLGGYRWGLDRKRSLLEQERTKRRG
jgi:AraC family transcriptional regulator, regulatory protein of adaptative response / methylated-DNA-[protein]-cysteine methyltransferase